MHNVFREHFPGGSVKGCQFHLGHVMWRKIQERDLRYTFNVIMAYRSGYHTHLDLHILIHRGRRQFCIWHYVWCTKWRCCLWQIRGAFAVHIFSSSDSKFLPESWASTPENYERTNNAAEAFHSQFNAQFYAAHPNIYEYIRIYIYICCAPESI